MAASAPLCTAISPVGDREQQNRAGERNQHAKVEPVERLDVADQPGQHVARLTESQAAGGTCCAREIAEEPHPQIGFSARNVAACVSSRSR
jgi:hypothetical protein